MLRKDGTPKKQNPADKLPNHITTKPPNQLTTPIN